MDFKKKNLNPIGFTPFFVNRIYKFSLHKFSPSPPMCQLLQQAYWDQVIAQEDIAKHKIGLWISVQENKILSCTKSLLLIKLESVENQLAESQNTNTNLNKKIEYQDFQMKKLQAVKKELENTSWRLKKTEQFEYDNDTEALS